MRNTLLGAVAATAIFSAPMAAQDKHIIDVAASDSIFSTLVTAVQAAGLTDVLKGDGPFTVFAPTNGAFAKLPAGTVENLLKPENRDELVAILKYHIVPGKFMEADVVGLTEVMTVQGHAATIAVKPTGSMIDNARIIKTDIKASNGVIHVIDAVLTPRTSTDSSQ